MEMNYVGYLWRQAEKLPGLGKVEVLHATKCVKDRPGDARKAMARLARPEYGLTDHAPSIGSAPIDVPPLLAGP